ncbi:MAG: hemerythrin domain-containing protein [Planctomycetes bacterium]|nr:hemerythrin domain-containing protein [Planctomycetota bacterium]
MSTAHITTDHGKIQEWARQRGGKPAEVEGTGDGGPGVLRIQFAGDGEGQSLKPIRWPSLFRKFDEKGLGFLYQETTETGEPSRFCKFIYAPRGVLARLLSEHEDVRQTLEAMAGSTSRASRKRGRLLESLKKDLLPHMAGEEQVVYKAVRKACRNDRQIQTVLEGYEEHRHARRALQRLERADPSSAEWSTRQKVLKELLEHHIADEESEFFDLAYELLGADGLEELQAGYSAKEQSKLAAIS